MAKSSSARNPQFQMCFYVTRNFLAKRRGAAVRGSAGPGPSGRWWCLGPGRERRGGPRGEPRSRSRSLSPSRSRSPRLPQRSRAGSCSPPAPGPSKPRAPRPGGDVVGEGNLLLFRETQPAASEDGPERPRLRVETRGEPWDVGEGGEGWVSHRPAALRRQKIGLREVCGVPDAGFVHSYTIGC